MKLIENREKEILNMYEDVLYDIAEITARNVKAYKESDCHLAVVWVPKGSTSVTTGTKGAGQPSCSPSVFSTPGYECHFHHCPFSPGMCLLLTKLISLVEKIVHG